MGSRGLEQGLAFVEALDNARLDVRTATLEKLVVPDATWWIDGLRREGFGVSFRRLLPPDQVRGRNDGGWDGIGAPVIQ